MRRIFKGILWTLAGVGTLLLTVLLLLYTPFVQDWAADIALSKINDATGMEIKAEKLRLGFPLDVDIENASVVDAAGDTMAVVGRLSAGVKFWPLLKGEVAIGDIEAKDLRYRMGAPDSLMFLSARLSRLKVENTLVDLSQSVVDIEKTSLEGAAIDLVLRNDTTPKTEEASEPAMWKIRARDVALADVDYRMSMPSVADSIGASLTHAALKEAFVDMTSPLMEITAQSLQVAADEAYYVPQLGAVAQEGLDMNYLKVNDVEIAVDSFYNRGAEMHLPLTRLAAVERSGVSIEAEGVFEMDSVKMTADQFKIKTNYSDIRANALLGMGDFDAAPVGLLLDAEISPQDIKLLYPSLSAMLNGLPCDRNFSVDADVSGSMAKLNVKNVSAVMSQYFDVAMSGVVANAADVDNISGKIKIAGDIANADFVTSSVLDSAAARSINIPPMTLDGDIKMNRGVIAGVLQAMTETGKIAVDAKWNGHGEEYDLKLETDSFPVDAFLPNLGLGALTADATVSGSGYDFMSPACRMDADVMLTRMVYNGKTYTNARAWANLADGRAEAGVISLNGNADFDLEATAVIEENEDIRWTLSGDVRNADLRGLALSETVSRGMMSIEGGGMVNLTKSAYDVALSVSNLEWTMPGMYIATPAVDAHLFANDSIVRAKIVNSDLNADFVAHSSLDSLLAKFAQAATALDSQVVARKIDVDVFQRALPQFSAEIVSGRNNLLNNVLASSDMEIGDLTLKMKNDSAFNIKGRVHRLRMGETRLDTIAMRIDQRGSSMVYDVRLDNRPGTMDNFAHVDLTGDISDNKASVFVTQRNISNKIGFNLGAEALLGDSIITVSLSPTTPVIGYKNWTINEDNFISYNIYTRHFDAKMLMQSDESHFNLYTQHAAGLQQEDVVLSVNKLKLAELLSVSPYAPPIKGFLSADMRFRWDDASLGGDGKVTLDELYFGKDRVGSFELGVDLTTDKTKAVKADVSLLVDGMKTITATGAVNDTTLTNPFNLDFRMIKFPLRVVNPFLPPNTARLSGMLNGEMDITGSLASPKFNGYIDFDTTEVKINMIGSTFRFSEERVPVKDNVVTFSGYEITAANENPLTINGSVDMGDFISPRIDLSMRARNMQFINSSRSKGADIYGKGFVNVDAAVKGDMSQLDIDASLTLLSGSNITYIMTDAASTLASQSTGNMVTFVEFSDTLSHAKADTTAVSAMALDIDAMIKVSTGTTINVDMGSTGKVQIQGSGNLNYTMNDMADSRFTGRYTIDKGFVKYSPPIISEKHFDFKEGSYVSFNGDMLNPILNIHAVDEVKVNVVREGQNSRLVNFAVSVAVTNTLNNMNVVFDMEALDDITIQNELQGMSAEQRANQAMNLLLYNVYTGPGADSSSSMSGNPLYSFLESQINSWAANNIKFVDISFGIDQYDKTTDGATTTTTNYSYRVSKTLFNDRFKIVIGGNYSTDVDADEDVAQNLINDISFEYMLNRSGSMYVKIFRHVGYEDILEGEVTQTGVGFVYKRKIQKLSDLFRFRRRRSEAQPAKLTEKTVIATDEQKTK